MHIDGAAERLIIDLFTSQNLSFIGSVDENGFPSVRAMLRPRKREGIKTIFYSTNTPTNKTAHFAQNDKACVYVCDQIRFRAVLLTGTMQVLDLPEYKEMLWNKGDELYYPLGVTDPGYCVLKFTATSARVYTGMHSTDYTL